MNLNYLSLLAYLDNKPGKTLDEIAARFEKTPRSVQRWIADIKRDLPEIELEESFDGRVKRIRISKTLQLHAKSFGKQDVLSLYSLRLAIRLLNAMGLHDDCSALEAIEAVLLGATAHATRKLLEKQLRDLAAIEQLPLLPAGAAYQSGIANKLRYVALATRPTKVRLGSGRSVEGTVVAISNGPKVAVCLQNSHGEELVDMADIVDVNGSEDLWCDYARAA